MYCGVSQENMKEHLYCDKKVSKKCNFFFFFFFKHVWCDMCGVTCGVAGVSICGVVCVHAYT